MTDTSPAAVHSKLTRLFVMPRDIELHVDVQDICNALMAERDALSAQLAAANARVDTARDAALVEAKAAVGLVRVPVGSTGPIWDAMDTIDALRDKPAPAVTVQDAKYPDYCYSTEEWDSTFPWGDRDILTELMMPGEVMEVSTLIQGQTFWVVVYETSDGDRETRWVTSEAVARAIAGGGDE